MSKLVSILIAGALAVGTVGALTASGTGHHARSAKGQGVAAAAPMSDGAAADPTTTSTSPPNGRTAWTTVKAPTPASQHGTTTSTSTTLKGGSHDDPCHNSTDPNCGP